MNEGANLWWRAVERLSRLVSKMGHEVVAIMAKMPWNRHGFINQMWFYPNAGYEWSRLCGTIKPARPAIVFCTAYDQHALEAYKHKLIFLNRSILQNLNKAVNATYPSTAQCLAKPWTDLKTQRHQIAAKTYRGVVLLKISIIFWQIKNMSRYKWQCINWWNTERAWNWIWFIRIHRNALVSIAYLDGL